MASSFGTGLGGMVHVLAGALGVSAIILASAALFTVLKLVGQDLVPKSRWCHRGGEDDLRILRDFSGTTRLSLEGRHGLDHPHHRGVLEVVWAASMKASDGFTRLVPSTITVTTMIASFALLAWAMRTLPLGTAYAVWVGIGAIGAFAFGTIVLHEPATPMRLAAAVLIFAGIVTMKLATPT
jgi:quaternary ammonium compound-resistance protein SugE